MSLSLTGFSETGGRGKKKGPVEVSPQPGLPSLGAVGKIAAIHALGLLWPRLLVTLEPLSPQTERGACGLSLGLNLSNSITETLLTEMSCAKHRAMCS